MTIFNYSGQMHYKEELHPLDEKKLEGFSAISYNQDFAMTGWWQNSNVAALYSTSAEFQQGAEATQEIRIQQGWDGGEFMPWVWNERGTDYTLHLSATKAIPVAYGDAFMQGLMGFRFEHILTGERVWIQMRTYTSGDDSDYVLAYRDPHTNFTESLLYVQGESDHFALLFDTTDIKGYTWGETETFDFSMTRQQFATALEVTGEATGQDYDTEPGWWSLIQAHVAIEQASFDGQQGFMQMQLDEFSLEMY